MSIISIIPARMSSSRFPGKPMAKICGIPMVGHVYFRTRMARILDEVYVATCDAVIQEYVESIGGKAIMTQDTHQRCGDRVAEALTIVEKTEGRHVDIVVLVQGDEPLVHPDMIEEAVKPLREDPEIQIVNLVGEIKTAEEWLDPNTVKVVLDRQGFALYFSREPIPSGKKWRDALPMKKQICIIPHRRDFLVKFARLEPTILETIESIDMLRVLEHGYKVKMVPTQREVASVDTPNDLVRAEALMRKDPLFAAYAKAQPPA
jgi:3-deoxy-manno-octulosonate cytidylyltransferase (CMP-KDO synthetase)